MATTTNYGWTTPDDTGLVKDGAAAIRTLGSSVDTSVKALNPGTTSGDLDYYTAATTKARIAKGTAGQVFTMNAGATAPEWQTASSGGMTLISTTTLTGASVTLSSIPQTYTNLQIVCRLYLPATTNTAIRMSFNADTTANRHRVFTAYGQTDYAYNATFVAITGNFRNSAATGIVVANLYDYANATTHKLGDSISIGTETTADFTTVRQHFAYNQTTAISSLSFYPTAGNFTSGTLLLYGVK